MRSQQVNLTEEEKETLKAEGLPIPTTLPLTKACDKLCNIAVSFYTRVYIYMLASGASPPIPSNRPMTSPPPLSLPLFPSPSPCLPLLLPLLLSLYTTSVYTIIYPLYPTDNVLHVYTQKVGSLHQKCTTLT